MLYEVTLKYEVTYRKFIPHDHSTGAVASAREDIEGQIEFVGWEHEIKHVTVTEKSETFPLTTDNN